MVKTDNGINEVFANIKDNFEINDLDINDYIRGVDNYQSEIIKRLRSKFPSLRAYSGCDGSLSMALFNNKNDALSYLKRLEFYVKQLEMDLSKNQLERMEADIKSNGKQVQDSEPFENEILNKIAGYVESQIREIVRDEIRKEAQTENMIRYGI